jgi:uncharacterized protein YyaL (SSP411 family)
MANRLIHEKSPYLLQHAHNPVDWYPWGREAFEKARKEDKPLILSIGYSTCHWCHVMEEESFENPAIAKIMNDHFVSIKVDREERPDLDSVYMNYVMAVTGSGGWPMTVFLTPDKEPFYGGTYFPPESRFGMPGFPELLLSIAEAWKNRRDEILKSAQSAVTHLRNQETSAKPSDLSLEVFEDCFQGYAQRFDALEGGFGSAPKFPMGHTLSYLLRYWKRSGNPQALEMVERTLEKMAKGGIYDQVGGGFHRYSTDRDWFLPHFEKMLYDQALLSWVYTEAYQATGKKEYQDTARGILDYVLREMTSKEGGFFSAQDADSPDETGKKREGAFYVWKKSEIDSLFPKQEAEIISFYYGALEQGNVAQDPQGEFAGKNVFSVTATLEEAAERFKTGSEEILKILDKAKTLLLQARAKRPPLHLDDKTLTDWNGLMIASFAYAAGALGEPRYKDAAIKAVEFVLAHLVSKDGRLLHRWRDGQAAMEAGLDDYAFLIYGLIHVYQATGGQKWLEKAAELSKKMVELFWDEKDGGFFMTSKDAEALITRPKQDHDGAVPSGNAVAALSFLMLTRLKNDNFFEQKAGQIFKAFAENISLQPMNFSQMMSAFDWAAGPSLEITLEGDPKDPVFEQMLHEIYVRFIPNRTLFWKEAKSKTAAHVCRGKVCRPPVYTVEELRKILELKT